MTPFTIYSSVICIVFVQPFWRNGCLSIINGVSYLILSGVVQRNRIVRKMLRVPEVSSGASVNKNNAWRAWLGEQMMVAQPYTALP